MKRRGCVVMGAVLLSGCAQLVQQTGIGGVSTPDCPAQGKQLDPKTDQCVPKASAAKSRARVAAKSSAAADPMHALLEPDADLDATVKDDTRLISGLVGVVRANSYPCDAVSAVRPFENSNGFRLACDNFRYKYNIESKDGRWIITTR
jgi:outer membrane murein-binding lipoprotein Lpp